MKLDAPLKQFIKHRVNTIQELKAVETTWGVEIDLRSNVSEPGKIHLSHDPWKKGEDFEEWLAVFASKKLLGPVALNTKEDSLEETVTNLLKKYGVDSYFFLDTPAPTLIKHVFFQDNRHFAVRTSKFEIEDSIRPFEGKVDWMWVDCFKAVPLAARAIEPFQKSFRICLVSPELHGAPYSEIDKFEELYSLAHAVCTKNPQEWISRFGTSTK